MMDISLEIANLLSQYTEEVQEVLEASADEITQQAVKTLRDTSPKRKGKYAKSWVRKKINNSYVIHNKRYYLTHLLEKGHAKRGGGRVAGIKHIAPVEQKVVEAFEQKVREQLK